MVTPQKDDEAYYRQIAKLPPMSPPVDDAWEEDGGVRRPITLKSGEAFAAEQSNIADAESAAEPTEEQDEEPDDGEQADAD